jgi:F-type H+-transporting ATPase subunit b
MSSRLILPLLVALVLVAPPALASGGGAPPPIDVTGILRHLVNLVALIALLGFALKTPTRDFLAFRRTTVKEQLDEAWDAKSGAEERYSELQGRLDNFSAEIDVILTRVREDAEAERARIVAQAERSASQMAAAAERTVEEERRRARSELRAEAIDLALGMAESAISGGVREDDHSRLATNYLSKMQETPRP